MDQGGGTYRGENLNQCVPNITVIPQANPLHYKYCLNHTPLISKDFLTTDSHRLILEI